jgi:hypothetical protein
MAKKKTTTNGNGAATKASGSSEFLAPSAPRSLKIFERGVKTGQDFAAGMSALMGDVISGTVTPQIANAVCNAGGKMLKVVEMSHRWGRRSASDPTGDQVLQLSE